MILSILNKLEPLFSKGGKLEKFYPLFEGTSTFFYTPGVVTHNTTTHVRDVIDFKRLVIRQSMRLHQVLISLDIPQVHSVCSVPTGIMPWCRCWVVRFHLMQAFTARCLSVRYSSFLFMPFLSV